MKINIEINNEPLLIESDPNKRLSVILRQYNLLSVKCGCNAGTCGSCTVLLDGKTVPSCIIPIAAVRNSKIITMEHFITTAEGVIITNALKDAQVHLCGFCNAEKYFKIYEFLQENPRPSRELSFKTASSFACRCIDTDSLIEVINKSALQFRNLKRGNDNGSK